jgi:hypothetical protein
MNKAESAGKRSSPTAIRNGGLTSIPAIAAGGRLDFRSGRGSRSTDHQTQQFATARDPFGAIIETQPTLVRSLA